MDARVNPDLGGEIGFSSDARNWHRDHSHHTHIKATRKIYLYFIEPVGLGIGLGLKLNGFT